MSLQVLLIEHDEVDRLYPFAETRCSWEIRTGFFTIVERWTAALPNVSVTVESHRDRHMRSFVERHPDTPAFQQRPTIIIGGHVLLAPSVMHQLAELASTSGAPFLIGCGGHTVGAFVPEGLQAPIDAVDYLSTQSSTALPIVECTGHVLHRSWQAIDHIERSIGWDAEVLAVHVSPEAHIHSTAVLDTTRGPILIGRNVSVGALAVIEGPVALGDGSIVKPHAHVRSCAFGPHTRVGGEIDSSIVQEYANKQHLGFVGHSYIGAWVNLGAGTTSSNLKNTYGHVRVLAPWGEEDSQRQFLGVCIGEHTKSAIGTLFPTGCLCGVSANIVVDGFVPRSVASFQWKDTAFDVDRALDVARTAMSRRGCMLGPETEALLRYLAG